MSSFYDYEVIAKIGDLGIQGFGKRTSINDQGQVAFIGDFNGVPFGSNAVFVGDGLSTSVNITPNLVQSNREFGTSVQINNAGEVVASWRNTSFVSNISLFDSNNPNSFETIATGGGFRSGFSYPFDYYSILPLVSVNNSGESVFVAFDKKFSNSIINPNFDLGDPLLVTASEPLPISFFDELVIPGSSLTPSSLRPMIADNGNVIVKWGNAANSPIVLFDNDLNTIGTIADSSQFTKIGQSPGISDDGQIVVFAGDLVGTTNSGIFLSYQLGSSFSPVFKIAGKQETVNGKVEALPELGYDALGNPLFFSGFNLDSRIGVTHFELGKTGLEDDSVVITFVATPNASSRDNPAIAGTQPLLFSKEKGIWQIRVDFEAGLSNPSVLYIHPTGAIPVIQVGDTINGGIIKDIDIYDPISNATQDLTGNPRNQQLGDHRIAFWADTTAGEMIISAEYLDSDQDGLLDDWEINGIDIDKDGVIDLNLKAMGANPLKKDLFLEIDWLAPRTSGVPTPWKNDPNPKALQNLVNMFANAPVTNPDKSKGITLHIDAGAGLSINMLSGSLQGGDQIGQPGLPNRHIDVVYFGTPNSINVPGVETRSFHDIKDNFFGSADKRARELAFHYSVLADFHSFIDNASGVPFTANITKATDIAKAAKAKSGILISSIPFKAGSSLPNDLLDSSTGNLQLEGKIVKITSGKGEGQIRQISENVTDGKDTLQLSEPWTVPPDDTSQFVLISDSSGRAEVDFYNSPDFNSVPGNDFLVTLGAFGVDPLGFLGFDDKSGTDSTFYQWRTMAHELGHTLGLRHGGTNPNQDDDKKDKYLSLMSYSHQVDLSSTVNSYADASDQTFDDWANIKLDFINSSVHLGNTFGLGLGTTATSSEDIEPELTFYDFQKINYPIPEENKPTIIIQSPSSGTTIPVGNDLTVTLIVTDDSGVDTVNISFDINGDGDTDDVGEFFLGSITAPDTFESTFTGISGLSGIRTVWVVAEDIHGNTEIETIDVNVTALASNLTLTIDPNTIDENGTAIATITRNNSDNSAFLNVNIVSSDTTEASVPSIVTIPASQNSITFNVTGINDGILDGNQLVTITASANGFTNDSDNLTVTDVQIPTLTIVINPTSISENGGVATGTITRNRNSGNLTINLNSNDTSEATVPSTVTIPNGNNTVNFTITAVDDAILDGSQLVTITASASGFSNVNDTITVTDDETPTLTLTINPDSISENGGTATGTLTRNSSVGALTINLNSNDTTEATVPNTVTIPNGSNSVNFTINAVDDLILDGSQLVTITASASGFSSVSDTLTVTDDEIPTLTLTINPDSISENGGTATGTLTRNSSVGALTINLNSNDTSEATVPNTVTIPNGSNTVNFTITAVDDAILDGSQLVTINASASGFSSVSDILTITDDETPTLTLTINPDSISENGGTATGTLTRNSSVGALTINLNSNDTTEATVPNTVTIPNGSNSVNFTINAVDDLILDGSQLVTITASASGFSNVADTVTVLDDETTPPDNIIQGTSNADILTGTAIDEVIIGAERGDILRGNGGNDEFVYNSMMDAGDFIADFNNGDKINMVNLLDSISYGGTNPINDNVVGFINTAIGSAVTVNNIPLLIVQNVSSATMNDPNNFIFV